MLPIFHIRGLLNRDIDSESRFDFHNFQHLNNRSDVQLDKPEQYDELIQEHPVATLGYIDDDDGEIITVGSSMELFDRVDELQSLRPIVFDLLASLRRNPDNAKTAEGVRVWAQFVNRKFKGKGKAPILVPVISDSPPASTSVLEDVDSKTDFPSTDSKSTGSKSANSEDEQNSFLEAFEEEFKKLLEDNQIIPETSESFPEVYPPAAEKHPTDIISQALSNVKWATQNINSLRQNLPQCAQPAVENLSVAVQGAMGALAMQLSQVAQEASVRAQQAASATRDVDTTEIEAVKERIRYLAVGIGHVAAQGAQAVGRDVGKGVHDGFGAVAIHARKVGEDAKKEVMREVNKARKEIGRSVHEAINGLKLKTIEKDLEPNLDATEKEVVAEEIILDNEAEQCPIENDSENRTNEHISISSSPAVEFVPASQFKSFTEWLKAVKGRENVPGPSRRHTFQSEISGSKEQEAIAFWQQMDRISHFTSECNPCNSTTEELKACYEKEVDENDSFASHTSEDTGERRRWSRRIARQSMYELGHTCDGAIPNDRKRRSHNRRNEYHGPPHLPSPPPHIPGQHPRTRLHPPPSPPCGLNSSSFAPPPPPPPPPPSALRHYSPLSTSFLNPTSPMAAPAEPFFNTCSSSSSPLHKYHPPPPSPRSLFYMSPNGNVDNVACNGTRYSRYSSMDDTSVRGPSFDPSYPQIRRARTVIGSTHAPSTSFQGSVNLSRRISPVPSVQTCDQDNRSTQQKFPEKRFPTGHKSYYISRPLPSRATYSEYEAVNVVDANPFATPPRVASPQLDIETENQEREINHPDLYQGYESDGLARSAPVQAQVAEMAEMAATSFFGEYPSQSGVFPKNADINPLEVDKNPFSTEAWRQAQFNLPGSFPTSEDMEHSEPQIKDVRQEAIDRCVAQLVEMGYGRVRDATEIDTDENEDVERLKIYAQISHGDLDEALEMLEEEKTAWERHN